jgi:hypothetical protein
MLVNFDLPNGTMSSLVLREVYNMDKKLDKKYGFMLVFMIHQG